MPSTDLVLRSSSDVPEGYLDQMKMAGAVSESGLLPAHLRGKPANVLVILAGARALNISWFWATQSLYVVEGKLSYSAELMRGLVIRAGHKFRILEATDKVATVQIVRSDDEDHPFTYSFTMDDAKKAELSSRSTWKKFPAPMLLARATSFAVRSYCPDVLFGVVYTPEELGAKVEESGEPIVDNNGHVVLEGDLVDSVEVPQEVIDKAGWEIAQNPDIKASASTLLVVRQQGYENLVPNFEGQENTLTLEGIWMARLKKIVADDSTTKDDYTLIWQVAKGTDVLELGLDSPGDSLKTRILAAIEKIKVMEQKAADLLKREVEAEIVAESVSG